MFKIQFLGAAETVTGSCYLVTTDNAKFIVDCGMFQGTDIEARNAEPWPFRPSEVDFVILTHAHIDHSGLLPKLTKHGFTGEIYATRRSVEIAELLLMDSAKIQEKNAQAGKYFDEVRTQVQQYYNSRDAEYAISRFHPMRMNDKFTPKPGVEVEFMRAGHILGAVSALITVGDKRIVFSGDIGRKKSFLVDSYDPNDKREVDYVVMESCYGGVIHPSRESNVQEMMNTINEVTKRGGNVLIPAFSVQRTQELLIDLKVAKSAGALSKDLPIYVDSPLASKVTAIYEAAFDDLNLPERNTNPAEWGDIFDFPGLRIMRGGKQGAKMGEVKGSVIIAGSGMVNGGKILSHVIKYMPRKENHLMLVGFQAEDTYGRLLSEGVRELTIEGAPVTIRGTVSHLKGFSAHGDEDDLLGWVNRYKGPSLKKVFLVHAETSRAEAFKHRLAVEGYGEGNVQIPDWKEEYSL